METTAIQSKSGSGDLIMKLKTDNLNYGSKGASSNGGLHVTKTNITNDTRERATSSTSLSIKAKPPIYDKLSTANRSNSSIVFLGEREMPITSTRDGVFKTQNKASSFGGIGTGSAYHMERSMTEHNNRITFGMGMSGVSSSSLSSSAGVQTTTVATASGTGLGAGAAAATSSASGTATKQLNINNSNLNTVKTNEARINLANVLKENKLR